MMEAQLVDRLMRTPRIHSSNPTPSNTIEQFSIEYVAFEAEKVTLNEM